MRDDGFKVFDAYDNVHILGEAEVVKVLNVDGDGCF